MNGKVGLEEHFAIPAARWFDAASISEADRLKIGRTNAVKLFNLDL